MQEPAEKVANMVHKPIDYRFNALHKLIVVA